MKIQKLTFINYENGNKYTNTFYIREEKNDQDNEDDNKNEQ